MTSKTPTYLKVSEVAKMFRVHQNAVYSWIQNGDLPAFRVGAGTMRIAEDDLQKFIRRNRS